MTQCDIGVIGMAVMGQNLALNMQRNGCRVAVYNRTPEKTHQFLERPDAGSAVQACWTLPELVAALAKPRRILIMVKAGEPVDWVIQELKPLLQTGDLLIDGGNSYYQDTERRTKEVESAGLAFLGVGVSGGEEGALSGPSIMPGGQRQAYRAMEGVFQAMAAKVDGEPCVTYIGRGGAGHYVKMVHNGIEYGDMQLIAEAYDVLKRGFGLNASDLQAVFERWNQGPLGSYLIEITARIFKVWDDASNQPLVETILDEAGQKGTGKWTSQDALDLGVPIPTINAAVEARILSGDKEGRVKAGQLLAGPQHAAPKKHASLVEAVGHALYASKICSYAQGFSLLMAASREYGYELNYSEIARIWRGGCIIRARFLDDVRRVYNEQPELPNLLIAPFFSQAVAEVHEDWREVVCQATGLGIPLPAISASLAYYDGYRSERLPANLIQAQRDFFGAHTYQRVDREGVFHTEWNDVS